MAKKIKNDKNLKPVKETENKAVNKAEDSPLNDLPIPPDIFEKLPKELQLVINSMSMHSFSSRRLPSPLYEKITEEHITSIIASSEKDEDRQFKLVNSGRIFNLIYFLSGIGVFIFLTTYFGKTDVNLYLDLVKVLVAFGGGFGFGFGYATKRKQR